jgi:hypothetical protein
MKLEGLPLRKSSQASQTELRNTTFHNSLGVENLKAENLQLKEGTECLDDQSLEHHLNEKSVIDENSKPIKRVQENNSIGTNTEESPEDNGNGLTMAVPYKTGC